MPTGNAIQSAFGGGGNATYVIGPSGDTTGATDHAAIQNAANALISKGGIIALEPGTYYNNATITVTLTGAPVSFTGAGWGVTVVNFTGSGDCFRILCPTLFTSPNFELATCAGGMFTGITIDGTSHTGTAASGLHLGDVLRWTIDVSIRNFTATGDIGLHLDNTWFWTEQLNCRVMAYQCVSGVVFDQNPNGSSVDCTGSFDGGLIWAYILTGTTVASGTYNGVVFQNGTYIVGGALRIEGGFTATSASVGTAAALKLTGSSPAGSLDSSKFSALDQCQIDIAVECESGSGANTPYSIYLGTVSSGNNINDSYGVLAFDSNGANFTNTNGASAITIWAPVVNDVINPAINKFVSFNTGAFLGSGSSASNLELFGNLDINSAGFGLQVAEGSNCKQGTAVLVAGSKVVANTAVTASSRIFLTSNADGGAPGFVRVSARTAGTSFTITSSSNTDTSTIAYEIFEPG